MGLIWDQLYRVNSANKPMDGEPLPKFAGFCASDKQSKKPGETDRGDGDARAIFTNHCTETKKTIKPEVRVAVSIPPSKKGPELRADKEEHQHVRAGRLGEQDKLVAEVLELEERHENS